MSYRINWMRKHFAYCVSTVGQRFISEVILQTKRWTKLLCKHWTHRHAIGAPDPICKPSIDSYRVGQSCRHSTYGCALKTVENSSDISENEETECVYAITDWDAEKAVIAIELTDGSMKEMGITWLSETNKFAIVCSQNRTTDEEMSRWKAWMRKRWSDRDGGKLWPNVANDPTIRLQWLSVIGIIDGLKNACERKTKDLAQRAVLGIQTILKALHNNLVEYFWRKRGKEI